MTQPTYEPDTPARREQRLGTAQFTAAYSPDAYTEPKAGPGQVVTLYAQGGAVQLGYLWTSDAGGLGFVPTSDAGVQRVPEFYRGFSKAKAARTKAATVFQDYAGRGGLGLSAGPIRRVDDLATLPA